MKTLEKSEMLERNKVGRVLTEENILNQGQLIALHPGSCLDCLQTSLWLQQLLSVWELTYSVVLRHLNV